MFFTDNWYSFRSQYIFLVICAGCTPALNQPSCITLSAVQSSFLFAFLYLKCRFKMISFVVLQAIKLCERTRAIRITTSDILEDDTDLNRTAQEYIMKNQVGLNYFICFLCKCIHMLTDGTSSENIWSKPLLKAYFDLVSDIHLHLLSCSEKGHIFIWNNSFVFKWFCWFCLKSPNVNGMQTS